MHVRTPVLRAAMIVCMLIVLSMCFTVNALAASAKVATTKAGVFKTTKAKKPSATLKKGTVVTVLKANSKWLKIKYKGKIGYMKRAAMKKVQPKTTSKSTATKKPTLRKLSVGNKGTAVKKLQQRLAAKGYLKKSAVNGKFGGSTKTAIRQFQMFNSLSITGTATVSTQKKLLSSSARSKPKVSAVSWGSCGINSAFPNRSSAVIIDVKTGVRINIRRLYGSNHCDVEPKTAADTKKLKAIYGGSWSWDSRGVLLIAGGKCFAAAINSMPHGGQISTSNGYPGQFCLHLRGSKTHGTNKVNAAHQSAITKVYNYFR